jgi:hypothetical protein
MVAREESIARARDLMMGFAERTGLASGQPERRYLWTDAFAVLNFLEIGRVADDRRATDLALLLVDRVHHVLGRHRPGDPRTGWISGLGEREGEAHPTRGGLRIGKDLPERGPGEPFDERLEWDRDGQYFHYLTKWMHALDQVSRATRDPRYNLWARELADTAHSSFAHGPDGPPGSRRMHWKMSTDLSRPLVPSMGQHDPLDGLITCVQLEATASLLSRTPEGPGLKLAIADFAAMVRATDIRTVDPLGLGGLLSDACRVAQLMQCGAFAGEPGVRGLPLPPERILEGLLATAQGCLPLYSREGDLEQPASRRLAFRELGLAIGLSAIDLIRKEVEEVRARIQGLAPYADLGSAIVAFWLDPEHQRARTWSEHRDINEVMLATSLIPDGFLVLARPAAGA